MSNQLIKKTVLNTCSALSICLLTACSSTGSKPAATEKIQLNDFPTQARVEFVLQCMQRHRGEKNYATLYSCACTLDKLASLMPYDTFTQAQTFQYMKKTPGEKGAIFRDSPQSKPLREQLKTAQATAESACFVKQIQ